MSENALLIKNIIAEKFDVPGTAITEQASFINDLGVDSLDLYELIMEVEKKYNLVIPDESAETLTTVGSLIIYIDQHSLK
jgi:acyl carrier protein